MSGISCESRGWMNVQLPCQMSIQIWPSLHHLHVSTASTLDNPMLRLFVIQEHIWRPVGELLSFTSLHVHLLSPIFRLVVLILLNEPYKCPHSPMNMGYSGLFDDILELLCVVYFIIHSFLLWDMSFTVKTIKFQCWRMIFSIYL